MSTYNGEKYITEQINSILNQKDIDVKILVRDDGSTDGTVNKIKELISLSPDSIVLIEGENLGYRKSFLDLFNYISVADYYCFSDQDDYWMPDKIISAINILKTDNSINLYASSLTLTDENLQEISKKSYFNRTFTLESFFIRTQLAGCTYVFKPEIAKRAREFANLTFPNESMPDHDALICIITKAINSSIYVDDHSYILHRRLSNSQTAGKGLVKRIEVERKRIVNRQDCFKNTATVIINSEFYNLLTVENKKFIKEISQSNINFKSRISLLFNKKFSTGNFVLDFIGRIKVILKKY